MKSRLTLSTDRFRCGRVLVLVRCDKGVEGACMEEHVIQRDRHRGFQNDPRDRVRSIESSIEIFQIRERSRSIVIPSKCKGIERGVNRAKLAESGPSRGREKQSGELVTSSPREHEPPLLCHATCIWRYQKIPRLPIRTPGTRFN